MVARTTCSMPEPAVSRMCLMFFSACAACSPAVSPDSSPVAGRCPAGRRRTRIRWPSGLAVGAECCRGFGGGHCFQLFAHTVLLCRKVCCRKVCKRAPSMCQYAHTCAICVAPEIILFRWVEAGKTVHRTIWPELAPHDAAGTKTAESQGKPRKNTTNEQQKSSSRSTGALPGGLDGDRTHDLLFRRQTLYPLSYKPMQRTTVHGLRPFATRFGEKRDADLAIVGKVSTRAQCIRVLGATSTRCTLST